MDSSNRSGLGRIDTLVDLLSWQAGYQPDWFTYTFLEDGEADSISLSNQELAQQAQAIGAALQLSSAVGERVLLLLPPGLNYIAAFFGCLYGGAIAVPVYPPRPNRPASRLQAIVKNAQPSVVLTTDSLQTTLQSRENYSLELDHLTWIAVDEIEISLATQWQMPPINGDSLAFLQYTSGSTAAPKGVMVSHSNLLSNLEIIGQYFGVGPQSRSVTWLPPYHDMGLIGGLLQSLYSGSRVQLMSPVAFLQQPIRWLQAITKFQADINGGPNFAYELCLSRIKPEALLDLDLSSWNVAFCGAEPIRADTLDRFTKVFEPCGFRREAFYPCYGMAESTLLITGGQRETKPIYQTVSSTALEAQQVVCVDNAGSTLVSCGQSPPSQTLMIVNPDTCRHCDDNQVGEIWVASPSIAQGYWQQPEKTQTAFHAYLTDTQAGPFFRTGDLGFLLNNELFITGRLKDLIIIRGRNHYPQDIELTVEKAHPALRPVYGAAFAVEAESEERLVVVHEVERRYLRKLNVPEITQAVRQAISEHHDLQVYAILLLKTGSIPKTSSGKIQRYACRQSFQKHSLDVVGDWLENPLHKTELVKLETDLNELKQQVETLGHKPTTSQTPQKESGNHATDQAASVSVATISSWLVARFSQRLKVKPADINIHDPFSSYGLDSATAVSLSGELEEWLECRLAPTLIYDYPSIDKLSQYLATGTAPSMATRAAFEYSQEPIAVVGMECRFPGAENLEAFWQLLQTGQDAIKEIPGDRWNTPAQNSAVSPASVNFTPFMGGFLEAVDEFDATFFGITPREAIKMDPQQRWLLEVAWAALEHAGCPPTALAGSLTGVFVGTSSSDYGRLLSQGVTDVDAYVGTGNAPSIAANRLSYCLHLQGPSLAVDTACSSSLVAVHLACQSLRLGECNLALAGGVNALLTPDLSIAFSEARMLAADGRCKTFDAAADGYGRSEGCGLVVLKRLSDAEKAGDRILAVIRGSAINQDGRSNGLTAPNGLAQQAVIRQALANAGVAPNEIQYIEAHGTGTPLGDPIEVSSLQAVLGADRPLEQPCGIGSVKTNVGHLEAAAGIAGLIKVVLALHHQQLPPHLHLHQLNPQLHLEGTPFFIPTQSQSWPDHQLSHLAGVSSFGFGGTNAHVVLASAANNQQPNTPAQTGPERPYHLLALSAKTDKALHQLAKQYSQLAATSAQNLGDICFSANTGRSHFGHRLAIVAQTKGSLAPQLLSFDRETELAAFRTRQTSVQTNQLQAHKVAFLFTGQGAQYVDMGRQLYETQPTFRDTLQRCDQLLQPYLEQSLLSVLYPDLGGTPDTAADLIHQTAYTQPALFALEYALAQLWLSWGIEPDVVMGHSVGEYVAACIAGVFTLEDGLKLIAHRGRLMQSLPENGAMVVVAANADSVRKLLKSTNSKVAIAAINGPQNVVLSGEAAQIDSLIEQLTTAEIKTKRLQVSHAFHSPLVEPILDPFQEIATTVEFRKPQLTVISNLTGQLATSDIATPEYWVNHIRQPVQFNQGMETLQQQCKVLLEIGPKPVLLGMGHQCFEPETVNEMQWLPSLRPGQDDWSVLLKSLGTLYSIGIDVDWPGFDRDYQRRQVSLPTYPFQRQRYWFKHNSASSSAKETTIAYAEAHPLLGQHLESPAHRPNDHLWQVNPQSENLSYLTEHSVWQRPTLSLGTYIEMALAAAQAVWGPGQHQLQDLALHQPLFLPKDLPPGEISSDSSKQPLVSVQITLLEQTEGNGDFQVHSRWVNTAQKSSPWILNATAQLRCGRNPDSIPIETERLSLNKT
ncbi:MAG: beta-ketoacyl synthase N-terminal-like domain-containing protein [Cyanobacteria bacterium J06633_23]